MIPLAHQASEPQPKLPEQQTRATVGSFTLSGQAPPAAKNASARSGALRRSHIPQKRQTHDTARPHRSATFQSTEEAIASGRAI